MVKARFQSYDSLVLLGDDLVAKWRKRNNHSRIITEWIVSAFAAFLVPIFPHSDWIQRDTKYLSVFSANAGKHGPGKLRKRKTEYYAANIILLCLFLTSIRSETITKPLVELIKFSFDLEFELDIDRITLFPYQQMMNKISGLVLRFNLFFSLTWLISILNTSDLNTWSFSISISVIDFF